MLLLHGGGNFGDLWPTHHEFRCRLLEEFPHHRLIQLPQSVSFASTERRDRIARLIANHSDFHLFVRERQSFDVVLLDVMMPDLSGLDVLKVIREKYSTIALPVIMVTAKSEGIDVAEALAAGANDYVTKPVDFQEIGNVLDKFLDKHNPAREEFLKMQ